MKRRAALALAGAWHLAAQPQGRDTPMREASDLRRAFADGSPAKPFVLLLSIQGCPFCEFVRRSYLLPMNAEGKTNAWQLSVDRKLPLVDFEGSATDSRAWAFERKHRTTPTVLFLNAQGTAAAESLVGVVSSEFYGAVLDARLSLAAIKL